jgi:hypothetical protein
MNNKGSISIIGLMITMLIIAYSFINLSSSLQSYINLKFKTKAYLCTKYTIKQIDSYYTNINNISYLIKAAYYAQFIPEPTISSSAKLSHKVLTLSQTGIHFSFINKLRKNKYCKWQSTAKIVLAPPVKTKSGLFLKTDQTGAAVLKEDWSGHLIFVAPSPLDKFKDSLAIKLRIRSNKSKSITKFKIKAKELSLKALPFSNVWSGLL